MTMADRIKAIYDTLVAILAALGGGSSGVTITKVQGAANTAYSQVTAGASAQLLAARPTRREAIIKNIDASITVYIGTGTVTSANSMPLLAQQSMPITYTGQINCLAASGSPVVAIRDEYD